MKTDLDNNKIVFSLDCELLWGMKKGINSNYIEKNVLKSQTSLSAILSAWHTDNPSLYLAFVGKSLPMIEINDSDHSYLSESWPNKYLSKCYLKFYDIDIDHLQENVKLGLHSISHKFYTELSDEEKNFEIDDVIKFIRKDRRFRSIFVYPKNLADRKSIEKYNKEFMRIRVNSQSWLYRTNDKGVSRTKRLLRYIDSFFPLFELFCDKNPEHDIENAVVGTHFFRANLPVYLLYMHYLRLKFGSTIMKLFKHKMHVWSHPHNFGGNATAIKLFCRLAK